LTLKNTKTDPTPLVFCFSVQGRPPSPFSAMNHY
jgi:hypothetical protein